MKTNARRHPKRRLSALVVIVLLATYSFWTVRQPLPLLIPSQSTASIHTKATTSALVWPTANQASVGIVGSPILESHGTQTPSPMASTTKIITALAVLKLKPLDLNQQGPLLTLSGADVDIYNRYVAQDGSVVPVQAGEQISEYQALQAIMLPSANNIADSLAIWAYGSLGAYQTAANTYLAELGLKDTHVGSDASGLAPDSTSTAQDLVKLGELAMQNPVLAQIAGQSTATGIPLTSSVKNVNFLLGTSNIIGLKTGNSDQAGGVYVSASKTTVNNKPVTIVTALVGTPDLVSAVQGSLPLIRSAQANFSSQSIITAQNSVVGTYTQPWGGDVTAIASKDFTMSTWNGTTLNAKIKLDKIPATTKASQPIGKVTAQHSSLSDESSVPVILKNSVTEPSVWWRLTHPLR
ncbi:MAG: hypothetical protein JWL89_182 [Candidatus Saccharibacteria bacterium]|nr:hypothetical protein [Candidatus Saccharibacteria bacterium]